LKSEKMTFGPKRFLTWTKRMSGLGGLTNLICPSLSRRSLCLARDGSQKANGKRVPAPDRKRFPFLF